MKKLLCIIDMQNDFLTGCLGNAECAAAVSKVVDVIREMDFDRVILTKDTHTEAYMDTQEGRKLPVIHCVKGTEGWEINDEVQKAVEDKYTKDQYEVVEKPSFGSVSLGQILKAYRDSVDEAVEYYFVGVCTGICVISNVLIAKALLPEEKVCVIEKACACVTPDTHQTAIDAMATCQVDII